LSSTFESYHFAWFKAFIASKNTFAIIFISSSFIHLVVAAGVHALIQLGSSGFLGSYGIIFLFAESHTSSKAFSASFQVTQNEEKTSTSIK
jgi:hypothetical protein